MIAVMRHRPAALALLASACAVGAPEAEPVGDLRWTRSELALCAQDGALRAPLVAAANAWAGVGPAMVVLDAAGGDECNITVRYGEPLPGRAAETLQRWNGIEIREATITVLRSLGDASTDPTVIDLQGTITHELGHALGLPHIAAEHAVMSGADAIPGDVRGRELSPEDVDLALAVYPPAP